MSDTSFQVVLERTGQTLDIPADASILEVLELEGIAVASSCQQGVCGTCETRVLAGEIDHRDSVLSNFEKAQGQSMMICCSRAKGASLTLDL
ncbi:MAG: 2Fe-2S iron-sulfur cluster binding domain-containing protein [Cytophagales bacterium]|nr:2Fe-2S iron-sulfur cluster binding domain-containing protein [Cytophagales bacterium]